MDKSIKKTGRCHVFGDSIPLDEGVMAFKYAIGRITNPSELIPHLFECIDKDCSARIRPGDFVIAGQDCRRNRAARVRTRPVLQSDFGLARPQPDRGDAAGAARRGQRAVPE